MVRSDAGRRMLALTVIVLAAAVAGVGCGGSDSGGDGGDGVVKIGLLSATSGPLAAIGEEQNNGLRFYLSQHGDKLGGHPVELSEGDEGAAPNTAVAAARRIVTKEGVDVVVGLTSTATALAVKDITARAKVASIITSAGADELTEEGSEYVWRTHAPNNQQCGLASEAMLDAAEGGAFLTWFDSDTGRNCGDAVRTALEAKGKRVVGTAAAPLGTTDFQPYLAKIRQSKASVVFAFYAGSDGVAFMKQYVEFGLPDQAKLVASANMTEEPLLSATGDAALGVESVTYYAPGIENAANAKFAEPYLEEYGHSPNYAALASYDAAAVLDEALSTIDGDVSPQAIATALGKVGPIDSPRGTWEFNERHDPSQGFYVRVVKTQNGRLENVVTKDLGHVAN